MLVVLQALKESDSVRRVPSSTMEDDITFAAIDEFSSENESDPSVPDLSPHGSASFLCYEDLPPSCLLCWAFAPVAVVLIACILIWTQTSNALIDQTHSLLSHLCDPITVLLLVLMYVVDTYCCSPHSLPSSEQP